MIIHTGLSTPTRVVDLRTVHIAPDAGGWAVREASDEQPLATFRLEADALAYGRDYARRQQANLVVHFADGGVRFTERYTPG